MWVPAVVFLGCFAAAIGAVDRWLPDLAEGRVGGLAFLTVSGLLGAAAGLLGLHIYEIVRAIEDFPREGFGAAGAKADIFASGVANTLFEVGMIVGFATAVYLLAPPLEIDDETGAERAQAA